MTELIATKQAAQVAGFLLLHRIFYRFPYTDKEAENILHQAHNQLVEEMDLATLRMAMVLKNVSHERWSGYWDTLTIEN